LEFRQALVHSARQDLLLRLRRLDAPLRADDVIVRLGRPVRVLQQVVDELGAGLVVLGGKRHPALERWLGGSTALNAVRSLSVPVLVTCSPPAQLRRILVAVDISAAANPTLALAERAALAFGAELRAVNIMEPIPSTIEGGSALTPEYCALWEEMLKRDVWPLVAHPGTETVVRQGPIIDTLEHEAADWHADLLVVGSHGKGWVDRMLIGSVTERLLNHLPTSLLVVPIAAAAEAAAKTAPAATGGRHVLAWA
jgi:nucleotide-binding universal stress UspA family protein